MDHSEDWDHDIHNRLIDVRTGRVISTIHAQPGFNHAMNFVEAMPPQWSVDESLLLWTVAGKWCPTALVLLKIRHGHEQWQLNLLKTGQQALLRRTKATRPKRYLAEKKAHIGWGSAYPDGLTVDVHTKEEDTKTVSLPLKVHADLTSDPKDIEKTPLESYLDAVVTKDGRFVVQRFRLGPRKHSEFHQ